MLQKGHTVSNPRWHYHQQHLDVVGFVRIVLPFFINNPPQTHAPLFFTYVYQVSNFFIQVHFY